MMTLDEFNSLAKKEAFHELERCCVSKTWIYAMLESRPFSSENELLKKAATIWYHDCAMDDYKEAFTGHPKIGDVNSLAEKFAHTAEWAGHEQSGVTQAGSDTIAALAKANSLYEDRFGYIFIVSASGKSAEEMLAIIHARLRYDAEDEMYVAMNEQHKITVIRLRKMIAGLSEKTDLRSHLTTHALDTSIGSPAIQLPITLMDRRAGQWKPISVGITNADGRISDMLPPGRVLEAGIYTLIFDTETYYKNTGQIGFYPEVSIQFALTDGDHYHVPLLLNPFGYSTYKGS